MKKWWKQQLIHRVKLRLAARIQRGMKNNSNDLEVLVDESEDTGEGTSSAVQFQSKDQKEELVQWCSQRHEWQQEEVVPDSISDKFQVKWEYQEPPEEQNSSQWIVLLMLIDVQIYLWAEKIQ